MGLRRREMAELHDLQRQVWGDVSYERHVAQTKSARRARRRFWIAVGLLFLLGFGAGAAFVSMREGGTDNTTQPDLETPLGTGPATGLTTVPTTVPPPTDTSPPTTAPLVTTAATPSTPQPTAATSSSEPGAVTTAATSRGPNSLAHTGDRTDVWVVIALLLVAAGIALRKSARPRDDEP